MSLIFLKTKILKKQKITKCYKIIPTMDVLVLITMKNAAKCDT